jgi:hypothetical protein
MRKLSIPLAITILFYFLFGTFIWFVFFKFKIPEDIIPEGYLRIIHEFLILVSLAFSPVTFVTSFLWPKKWWWWGLIVIAPLFLFISIELFKLSEDSLLFIRTSFLSALKLFLISAVSGLFGKWLSENKLRINAFLTFKKKVLIGFIILLYYTTTWIYGRPAVKSSFLQEMQANYTTVMEKYKNSNDGFPYIKTSTCWPLLPGVLLAKESYMFAPLYGEGFWSIYLWIPSKALSLFRFRIWIS